MKVPVFGATGMVGHGVLCECLPAGDVDKFTAAGRTDQDEGRDEAQSQAS